ncbi:hypothetical protein C2G38_2232823 [Gigaspora rosea]|uniref:Uncharacterized protein n=1 Tax=Gigaspora rosea TaxID=44941 RepID=A0A397TTS5_9GLOM|nr:hypothetical protein C2G38_2232823 [Gigaspora rosea]
MNSKRNKKDLESMQEHDTRIQKTRQNVQMPVFKRTNIKHNFKKRTRRYYNIQSASMWPNQLDPIKSQDDVNDTDIPKPGPYQEQTENDMQIDRLEIDRDNTKLPKQDLGISELYNKQQTNSNKQNRAKYSSIVAAKPEK